MLTVAFRESTIGRTQVQLWYNRSKEGERRCSLPGQTSTSTTDENIEAVKKMILDIDCQITIMVIRAQRLP